MTFGRIKNLLLMVALLLGVSLTGISGTIHAQDATPESTGGFPVQIKVLNAMTASSTIDVYINGIDKDQRVAQDLAYGTFSDTYVGTSPVTEVVIKRPVDFGFDKYLFDTVIPTEAGQSYVVVVSDFLIIPMQLDLDPLLPGDAGNLAIARIVHAAGSAPSVDVLLNDEVILQNLRYGQAGIGGSLPTAAPYTVTLNQAGTSNLALTQDATLEADMSYVFVVIGDPSSTETPLTIVSDAEPVQASS